MEKYYSGVLQDILCYNGNLLRQLIDYFGSSVRLLSAAKSELLQGKFCREEKASRLVAEFKNVRDRAGRLQEYCTKQGIKLCSIDEPEYPELLKEIHNPPQVIFYRGKLADGPRIAMVGARKATAYGKAVAEALARTMAARGFVIVSGAAIGIDSEAHKGALSTGVTEAVLGCGVDVAYPPSNRKLLAQIAEKGAVISEFLPETPPRTSNFPTRNRIISGLAMGTVVVEAAEKSGSLITAEQAISEGRDIFAVPGSIFSVSSRGCNKLLQQGAKLVLNASDIMNEYDVKLQKNHYIEKNDEKNKTRVIMTEAEARIFKLLSVDNPLSVDEIIYRLHGRDTANVAFILLQLELRGLVRADDLHCYVRVIKGDIL